MLNVFLLLVPFATVHCHQHVSLSLACSLPVACNNLLLLNKFLLQVLSLQACNNSFTPGHDARKLSEELTHSAYGELTCILAVDGGAQNCPVATR